MQCAWGQIEMQAQVELDSQSLQHRQLCRCRLCLANQVAHQRSRDVPRLRRVPPHPELILRAREVVLRPCSCAVLKYDGCITCVLRLPAL